METLNLIVQLVLIIFAQFAFSKNDAKYFFGYLITAAGLIVVALILVYFQDYSILDIATYKIGGYEFFVTYYLGIAVLAAALRASIMILFKKFT